MPNPIHPQVLYHLFALGKDGSTTHPRELVLTQEQYEVVIGTVVVTTEAVPAMVVEQRAT